MHHSFIITQKKSNFIGNFEYRSALGTRRDMSTKAVQTLHGGRVSALDSIQLREQSRFGL